MNRSDGIETRKRLLDAAADIFAAKGFHDTRIADICQAAGGANMAAVNYHFGSKEELYVAAWRHAFERSIEAHPLDGGVAPDAPVEERLRGQILAHIQRIADPATLDFDIVHKEMACPTGLLSEIMRRSIEPMRERFVNVIREFLGPNVTEQQVQLCEMSIHSQCMSPLLHHHRRQNVPAGAPPPPVPALAQIGIEALADHIARFSLAGIRAIRQQSRRIRTEKAKAYPKAASRFPK